MKEKSVLEICFSSKYRCLEQAKKSRPVCATFLFSIKISRTDPLTVLIYQVSVLKSPNCDNCKNDSQKDFFFFLSLYLSSIKIPMLILNIFICSYAIFQIPHFTQEFLTGGWIFFKTRRLPVLDVRECAYCVISDSAPRKEILACSDL